MQKIIKHINRANELIQSFGVTTAEMIGNGYFVIIDAEKSIIKLADGVYKVKWVDTNGIHIPAPYFASKNMSLFEMKKNDIVHATMDDGRHVYFEVLSKMSTQEIWEETRARKTYVKYQHVEYSHYNEFEINDKITIMCQYRKEKEKWYVHGEQNDLYETIAWKTNTPDVILDNGKVFTWEGIISNIQKVHIIISPKFYTSKLYSVQLSDGIVYDFYITQTPYRPSEPLLPSNSNNEYAPFSDLYAPL